jgi:hypothetical protein
MSNQARQLSVPLTMNQADPDAMSKKILVLGAGELGMPVLRSLAQRAKNVDGVNISVLLRASAAASNAVRRTSSTHSWTCANCCAGSTRLSG